MQQGRRYRPNQEVPVKDWASFKNSWKNVRFIKEWGEPNTDQCAKKMQKSLDELIEDAQHSCYVFSDSLIPQYIPILINLIKSDKYKMLLDYEHEGLYLDNKKQLVIFKQRASVSSYLAKYRFPNQYEKLFQAVLQSWTQYQAILKERNRQISQDSPLEKIEEASKKLQELKTKELDPKLDKWKKLTIRIFEDFKKQSKKEEIIFLGINSILATQIKELCQKYEFFYANRYEKISQYDEMRDVRVTKMDQSMTSESFDDESSEDELNQNGVQENKPLDKKKQEKKFVIKSPRNIQRVIFNGFSKKGAKCTIILSSFGKMNPVDYIEIKLVNPCETEMQKKYLQRILVTEREYEYETVLSCLYTGISTYEFRTVNSVGLCKQPYTFKIWQDGVQEQQNSEGVMKIDKQNYALYILGQNQNGLIPNQNEKSENIIRTTNEQWHKLKLQCAQFSVATHAAICNREGQVASWGQMHYFDDAGIYQNDSPDEEDQDDDFGLTKIKCGTFRIESPSLISQKDYIRKVSCGQGYCLMADSLGRAWSFGLNCFGQLGLQNTEEDIDISEPFLIKYFKAENIFVTDVIASFFGASFAIDDKGQAYRWGTNQVDQSNRPVKDSFNNVINFQYPDVLTAQSMPLLIGKKLIAQKIVSIHPGIKFALALTDNNKLYGWGSTKYLGLGKVLDSHFEDIQNLCNPIFLLQNVVKISVGKIHCLALKTDNSLFGWGQSKFFSDKITESRIEEKPILVHNQFKGFFECGLNFTVFCNDNNTTMKIVGNQKVFKKGEYDLPLIPLEIKTGQGIVMIKTRNPKNPKPQISTSQSNSFNVENQMQQRV